MKQSRRAALWLGALAVVAGIVLVAVLVNRERAETWDEGVRELQLVASTLAATALVGLLWALARARSVGRRLVVFLLAVVAGAATLVAVTAQPGGPSAYAAAAAAAVAAGIAVFWWLPQWQATRWAETIADKDRVELEDNARGTVAQLLSGLGLIAAVAITLYQVNQGRVAADRTLELTADQQTTQLFGRAVDQLGARAGSRRAVEVRLGGIYSLQQYAERIDAGAPRGFSEETDAAYETVTSILGAYIRTNAPRKGRRHSGTRPLPSPCGGRGARLLRPLAPDLQAAVDVIDDIRASWERHSIYLPRFDLSNVELRGVDLSLNELSEVNLATSDLLDADLRYANLTRADLSWSDLAGANFYAAQLDGANLASSNLTGANFMDANLSGARLESGNLANACFRGADLRGANFANAVHTGAAFCGASVSPRASPILGRSRRAC